MPSLKLISLLALCAPAAASAEDCPAVAMDRGGCWDVAQRSGVATADECRLQCLGEIHCENWNWIPSGSTHQSICNLCHKTEDWTTSDEDWSPVHCADGLTGASRCHYGQACRSDATDTQIVEKAAAAAVDACTTKTLGASEAIAAAAELSALVKRLNNELDAIPTDVAAASSDAADALAADGCAWTGEGAVLRSTLEALLLAVDGDGDRAFPLEADPTNQIRLNLFDEHKIFLADAHYWNEDTLDAIHGFFDGLPAKIMTRGVRHDAPFATVQLEMAYGCDAMSGYGTLPLLTTTRRAFDLHWARQAGAHDEEAFDGTLMSGTDRSKGDFIQTVLRHECAHQFDRTLDDRQVALRQTLKQTAAVDRDYLRAGVASWAQGAKAFFDDSLGEIIASQCGNQYLLSSSTQLEVARREFEARVDPSAPEYATRLVPMGFFLLNLDVMGDATTSTFYEKENGRENVAHKVELERDPSGAITGLAVPGCGTWEFRYDGAALTGFDYDGPAGACVPDADADHDWFPTVSPTAAPVPAPTEPGAQTFPKCGVRLFKGKVLNSEVDENGATTAFICQPKPRAEKIRFGCCERDNTCARKADDGECFWQKTGPLDWYDAAQTCHDAGKELCRVMPTDSNNAHKNAPTCREKQCNMDGHYTWSAIECQPGDVGYDPSCEDEPTAAPVAIASGDKRDDGGRGLGDWIADGALGVHPDDTAEPTLYPTPVPTPEPTPVPSPVPTPVPSASPSAAPSAKPVSPACTEDGKAKTTHKNKPCQWFDKKVNRFLEKGKPNKAAKICKKGNAKTVCPCTCA